jgi:hypothetical protein
VHVYVVPLSLSLSRVMRCLYDRATRKVRKEEEELFVYENPLLLWGKKTNAGVSLLSLR